MNIESHPTARIIGHWTARVAVAFRTRLDQLTRELGMTGSEGILMMVLYRYGPSSLVDLADMLEQAHPSILRHVDTLENSGFVYRTPHKADRRRKVIALTDKGKNVIQPLRQIMMQIHQESTRDISEDSIGQLMSTLQTIYANLGQVTSEMTDAKLPLDRMFHPDHSGKKHTQ